MAGGRTLRWVVVVLLVATASAGARPRQDRIPDFESMGPREPPCESGQSWPKLKACLSQRGTIVTVLYDLQGAKLITMRGNAATGLASVALYTLRDNMWRRMSVSGTITPSSEVLSFTRLPKATGYRLDQGSILQSSAQLDPQTRVPLILRRRLTTICFDNGACQTVFTACDALIEGKTYWTFHGALSVDHGLVHITGDRSLAGNVCAPPRSTFTSDPIGDPLE